ncbi:hypothetical protein HPP92_005016 [Vanilla planifolia]|uniref:Calcium uniporter protein C-terminal domain-containing protein n=1 Tax=Vanilla planifolia TaxID=51239 RepID=A0A835VBR9_VANPL|nr:hypothetical protein HPP92_005016 [Vanilla planifolia]
MALRRTITHRFLEGAGIFSRQTKAGSGGNGGCLRRVVFGSGGRGLQMQAVAPQSDMMSVRIGGSLLDRQWWVCGDRLPVGVQFPSLPPSAVEEEKREAIKESQMEKVRSRLGAIPKSTLDYSELLRICCEASNAEQGKGLARSLDDSGEVIVHGNVVFLHPTQIAKAIENLIPLSFAARDDPRRKELMEMEKKKAMIDKKAEARVRRELWAGLGLFAAQTAAFMRLTFWELSWDVMEPICFFATSAYFMAGYVFFMRTSEDPSFEGFFRNRFATKQQQLMKAHRFDLRRFNELRRICGEWDV